MTIPKRWLSYFYYGYLKNKIAAEKDQKMIDDRTPLLQIQNHLEALVNNNQDLYLSYYNTNKTDSIDIDDLYKIHDFAVKSGLDQFSTEDLQRAFEHYNNKIIELG